MKEIQLTQGKVALVDDEDYEWLNQFTWYAKLSGVETFYAYRSVGCYENYRKVIMHREILHPPREMSVDHIDGDGLNNQKSNIRVCTKSENMHNRAKNRNNKSGYKGVCFSKSMKRWITRIVVNGKKIQIGYYDDVLDAARAYDDAAVKYFGKFSRINFPRLEG
jgi:hypothetical protein